MDLPNSTIQVAALDLGEIAFVKMAKDRVRSGDGSGIWHAARCGFCFTHPRMNEKI